MKQTLPVLLLIASTSVLAIASDDCLQKYQEKRWEGLEASMTLSSNGGIWYGVTLTGDDPGLEGHLGVHRDLTDNFSFEAGWRGASAASGTEYEWSLGGSFVGIDGLKVTLGLSEQSNTDEDAKTDWTRAQVTYSRGIGTIGAEYVRTPDYDRNGEAADIWSLHARYDASRDITLSAGHNEHSFDSTDREDYSNDYFGIEYSLTPGVYMSIGHDSDVYNSTTETTDSQTYVSFGVNF